MTDSQTRVDTDEAELQALVGTPLVGCAIKGCNDTEVDERGPVWMNAKDGTAQEYWVCRDHWENIFYVLGVQELDREDESETDEDIRPLEEILADLKQREAWVDHTDDFPFDEVTEWTDVDEVEAASFRKGIELMDDAGRMQDDDEW